MTDLHAPLDPGRPRKPQAPGPYRRPGMAALLAVAVLAANVTVLAALTRGSPETLVLSLPEPVAAEAPVTAALPPVSPGAEPGSTVVYGAPEAATQADDPLPVPTGVERDVDRQVSPGGPKIITLRAPDAADVGQSPDLAHLPEDSALEETAAGLLPVRAADGRRPMDIYARPWSGAGGKRIALVIGGLGLSQTGTQRTIEKLPPEITLAFAPSGNSLERWMREARKQGHELLVQVPMEPFGYPQIDPGPQTLRLASSAETNLENLHWAMSRLTNYTGIMNYMGGRFAGDEAAMAPVLGDLAMRGLLFFNDGTAGGPRLSETVRGKGVPYVEGNVVIDTSRNRGDILAQLTALEALAERDGQAVGSGSALELTVDTVAEWANEAKKRGFEIVGISALAR